MSVTGKGAGEYIFHRNALGDITHIYMCNTNASYNLVARYEYDAWGNHKVYNADGTENTDPEFIGNINPFRYRGYYYDVETKLYYLNARYYDPELCRFISADDTQYLDPNSVNGLNLFAYCNNNPIMNVDPGGTNKVKQFFSKVGDFFVRLGKGISRLVTAAVQVEFSKISYVGMTVASLFDSTVMEDMKRIKFNPFNSDEGAVLNSEKVSFYKGVPVFRTNGGRPGTFLGMWLPREKKDPNIVKHEWGHVPQLLSLGIVSYIPFVVIPSAFELCDFEGNTGNYYNAPWEAMADIFGGAVNHHDSAYDSLAIVYYWISWVL